MSAEAKLIHRFSGHGAGLYALSLHRDGKSFYSGGSDKILTSWSLDKMENEQFQAAFPNIIYSSALLPGQKEIAIGTFSGDIHIIDLKDRKEVRLIRAHTSGIFDMLHPEGSSKLVTASGDGSISFFDAGSMEMLKQVKICSEKVRSIAFSKELGKYAVAAGDGTVRIFADADLQEEKSIKAHELSANCVAWDPSGKYLISGGRDAHLRIWNTHDWSLHKEIAAHNFALYSIAFHPEGHLMATASRDKTIRIWDTLDFRPLLTLDLANHQGHKNSVNRLLWSAYQNLLISCSDDRTIIAWRIELHSKKT